MKTPSFYCENCGRKVLPGLNVCPGCGQEFSSVRCPSCGFTGEPALFKESCPECGYVGKAEKDEDPGQNMYIVRSGNAGFRGKTKNRNHLSPWLYKILIGIMAVIIVSLVRIYFLL